MFNQLQCLAYWKTININGLVHPHVLKQSTEKGIWMDWFANITMQNMYVVLAKGYL
jgi:hypothetical protein